MSKPGDSSLRKRDLPRLSAFLIGASVLTVVGFLVWASWAEIDQITRAPGQVIASSRNQLVQAPEGGVLQELLVREGTMVKKGQPLANFEKGRVESSFIEAEGKVAALRATVARLRAEVLGGQPAYPAELARYPEIRASQQQLFQKRRSAIQEEITSLERSLSLVREELDMNLPLLKTGDVSKAEVLKLQRQVAEVQAQITNRRNKYFQDSQAELVKAEEELASALQTMAQRREALGYMVLYSPMDGVVRNVRMNTRGGVARQGEEILQIVPVDDDLVFEAKVRPADIAFIKPGLPSTVKLDAYDYSIYGSLHGEVIYISADTLNEETKSGDQPYYRVHIKTKGRDLSGAKSGRRVGERIEITPGMTATVEIKTGSNTVLRFLTKPVTKTLSQSLGER
jgi:adhesin transport system membrane fusion protein